jgi:hypothetical protein
MWLLEDEYYQFLPTAAFRGCKKSLWRDKKLTQYKLWALTKQHKVSDRSPSQPIVDSLKCCDCNEGSLEGGVWQSLHAPAGRKRHTVVDTLGKRAVAIAAASVPEREASTQLLSFGLPDGTKGFTAVCGQAISLSWYPLSLLQPLRLGPNQPALRPIALPATSIDILPQLPNCKVLWHFLFGSFRYRIVCYS